MPAASGCPSCGFGPHEGARFCPDCGSSLTAARGTAEYKQVTVLFADVVRSMDIAAAVDGERLREIMTDLVERSSAVVRRYGGTVEYTGDGVMALFGAPIALEDHAFRGCLAALAIQQEANLLAVEVHQRDNVDMQLRVGLNSGRVIAGQIGSGLHGYHATGEPVGMAQRMESAAPPGGVMLAEPTARLVEHLTVLSDPEWVHIKGADEPVRARRLLSISSGDRMVSRAEPSLVGRRWEMAALDAILDRAVTGSGGVVGIVGPPGIGKSRVARETAALAAARGVRVIWTFCESHTAEVPFHTLAQMLRAATGVADLAGDTARAELRALFPDADTLDLLLFDDLLGIADTDVPLPQIDPDARRRRLTALVKTASLAQTEPALLVVEDAHWIDPVSESMLAAFLDVTSRTPAMVLVTYRPEYRGALTNVPGAQTIALVPLAESETASLLDQLLGRHPSVSALTKVIGERASGNPFFTEEMIRELVQRSVLTGQPGDYVCGVDVADVSVPATVQAAIEARIDRLDASAKRTLHAAAVMGTRFDADLLAELVVEQALDELLANELVDQVRFTPNAEYAFRHPLIRAVAYESQLRSDRAEWHRKLAAAIQRRSPDAIDEKAALIAEHEHAAGDVHAAYLWHMRAGAWSANRDVLAARLSWERACRIADGLPDYDPEKLSMCIAPRSMLCATDFHARAFHESRGRFAELSELCNAAGDKISLAIGMTGRATELLYTCHGREAALLASEQMALLESIGDPTLTVGLGFVAFACWYDQGEFAQILRRSQTIIDMCEGDPTKGAGFGFGSPLAAATAFRGVARWSLGLPGWRTDLRDAAAMAQRCDPTTLAFVLAWTYALEIAYGVIRADDEALAAIEAAVGAAGESGNDNALMLAEYNLAVALVYREPEAEYQRAFQLMDQALQMLRERIPSLVPITELWLNRERAKRGELDAVLPLMRRAVDGLHDSGRIGYSVVGTAILVDALLMPGTEDNLREAERAIERLADLRVDHDSAMLEITLLQLRALLARARGEPALYREAVQQYRALAESLGFEGHVAWAREMSPDSGS